MCNGGMRTEQHPPSCCTAVATSCSEKDSTVTLRGARTVTSVGACVPSPGPSLAACPASPAPSSRGSSSTPGPRRAKLSATHAASSVRLITWGATTSNGRRHSAAAGCRWVSYMCQGVCMWVNHLGHNQTWPLRDSTRQLLRLKAYAQPQSGTCVWLSITEY